MSYCSNRNAGRPNHEEPVNDDTLAEPAVVQKNTASYSGGSTLSQPASRSVSQSERGRRRVMMIKLDIIIVAAAAAAAITITITITIILIKEHALH